MKSNKKEQLHKRSDVTTPNFDYEYNYWKLQALSKDKILF